MLVQQLGVVAGELDVADDRVFLVMRQPPGLTHAAPFLHVVQNVDHLLGGQMGAVKDGAFAASEALR